MKQNIKKTVLNYLVSRRKSSSLMTFRKGLAPAIM